MTELRHLTRDDHDGLPVFSAPAPVAGEVTGTLMFRVGHADETLPTRGITHLVEHLALFPVGRPAYSFNGFVAPSETAFYATGTMEEVCKFLQDCARTLHDLPLDRLEAERRVLRAEAAGTSAGPASRLLNHRFGGRTYGQGVYLELGLRWLEGEEVQRWASERFVRGNAVLWLSDTPPDDFTLDLPPGPRRAPVEPEPLPVSYPAHVADGGGGVVLATWARRDLGYAAGVRIAGERLHDRLRREQGLTYSAYGDTETIGGRWRHALLGSDCMDRDAAVVREEIWRVASEMAERGPSPEELERYARQVSKLYSEPDALRSHLDYDAADELHGEEVTPSEQAVAELFELPGEEVARVWGAALEEAIMLAPEGLRTPLAGFEPYAVPAPEPVPGRVFRANVRRSGLRTAADELRVGDTGMTFESADATITIRWEDVVLVERRPREVLRFLATDDSWLEFGSHDVEDGETAKALALEHVARLPELSTRAWDNEQRLAPALRAALGTREAIDSELGALWDELEEDESVLAFLQGTRAGHTGLLTLTDRRLLWSTSQGERPDGLIWDWTDIAEVEARKRLLGATRLRFAAAVGDASVEFDAVEPAQAAQRAAEQVRERL